MSDQDEIIYWLTFINESGLKLNVVKPIIQRWCVVEQRSLTELFSLSELEWATTFGLAEAEIARLQTTPTKLEDQAAQLARWRAQGIEPLTYLDARYPTRLLQTLPPAKQPLILWGQGNLDLLNMPSFAILTTAAAEEQLLEHLLLPLVEAQISLISGYNRGPDRALFEAILQLEAGRGIAMLPMGLAAFNQTTPYLADLAAVGRVVMVSPFAPDTPYNESFAAARNLLIDNLAMPLLALTLDEPLHQRVAMALDNGLSLFVEPTAEPINQQLLEQGALPLNDPADVIELVQQAILDAVLDEGDDSAELPLEEAAPEADETEAEDYSLSTTEQLEPFDPEQDMTLLSQGGKIPEVLRKRLQNDS